VKTTSASPAKRPAQRPCGNRAIEVQRGRDRERIVLVQADDATRDPVDERFGAERVGIVAERIDSSRHPQPASTDRSCPLIGERGGVLHRHEGPVSIGEA
jgi:hypothetical protein